MMTMMKAGGGVEVFFPVVFFNGERTVDIGCVGVNPTMNYKGFQSIISQKIGVSPHQITTYFERTHPLIPSPFAGRGRRFPVTNKFDFAAALSERNCAYFLVVSKKSRRDRRRRYRQQRIHADNPALAAAKSPSKDNFVLLLRNHNCAISEGPNMPHLEQFPPIVPAETEDGYARTEYINYSNNTVEGAEVERYPMSRNLNSNVYSDLNVLSPLYRSLCGRGGDAGSSEMTSDDGASSSGGISSTGATPAGCEVCEVAKLEGQTAPFHCCKLDAVVKEAFRSSAGPIARPSSRLSG